MVYLLALLIGMVAGLRAMIVPAAVSWAAHFGLLDVGASWLSFLGTTWAPWVFSALAVTELVTDQLPSTPSRTVPVQFGTRLLTGALGGAVICSSSGSWIAGALAGAVGAVAGTLGGRALRGRLAEVFGRDQPAALLEDGVAIASAVIILAVLP